MLGAGMLHWLSKMCKAPKVPSEQTEPMDRSDLAEIVRIFRQTEIDETASEEAKGHPEPS